jgi:hypothetical protein
MNIREVVSYYYVPLLQRYDFFFFFSVVRTFYCFFNRAVYTWRFSPLSYNRHPTNFPTLFTNGEIRTSMEYSAGGADLTTEVLVHQCTSWVPGLSSATQCKDDDCNSLSRALEVRWTGAKYLATSSVWSKFKFCQIYMQFGRFLCGRCALV